MLDPDTVKALGLAGAGGIVAKPTLTYLGGRLKDGVETIDHAAVGRAKSLFERMKRRHMENGSPAGTVPERVAKAVLDEALSTDDVLMHEYLASISALSIDEDGTLDWAVGDLQTLRSLSVPSIHLHFHWYANFHAQVQGADINLGLEQACFDEARFCAPEAVLLAGIGRGYANSSGLASRIVWELSRSRLLELQLSGDSEFIRDHAAIGGSREIPGEGGFLLSPTLAGASLWALSMGVWHMPATFGHIRVSLPDQPEVVDMGLIRYSDLPPYTKPKATD